MLPEFGVPRIRCCDNCGAMVACRDWHDRCPHCFGYIIDRAILATLDRMLDAYRAQT